MRLWHYQMIDVLPRKHLLSQLRENTLIAVQLRDKGKTNHILVNPVMDYKVEEFRTYCYLIVQEMLRRGYKVADKTIEKLGIADFDPKNDFVESLFEGWHDERYLRQCYYNFQEKYDRGQFTYDEWIKIDDKIAPIII